MGVYPYNTASHILGLSGAQKWLFCKTMDRIFDKKAVLTTYVGIIIRDGIDYSNHFYTSKEG